MADDDAAALAALSEALEQREDENAALKQELAAMVAARDARTRFLEHFITVVGHDLRSPLSAIVMATALLGKAPLDARGARALARIDSSCKRAERLLRDLVDFARARVGAGIQLQRSSVDLHHVARQILDELQMQADRPVSIAVNGDARGNWDSERMGQVVANLVGTALKYSPASTDVRVEIDAGDGEVRLLVHSKGEPLAPAVLMAIHEPFPAGDDDGQGKSAGLGLSIAAEILRAHGGTLEARSSKDEGTTMVAHLPR